MNVIEEKLTKLFALHRATMEPRQARDPSKLAGGIEWVEGHHCSCGYEYPLGNDGDHATPAAAHAFHVTQQVLGRFMVMPTVLADDL